MLSQTSSSLRMKQVPRRPEQKKQKTYALATHASQLVAKHPVAQYAKKMTAALALVAFA
jgi:hypothetical protein